MIMIQADHLFLATCKLSRPRTQTDNTSLHRTDIRGPDIASGRHAVECSLVPAGPGCDHEAEFSSSLNSSITDGTLASGSSRADWLKCHSVDVPHSVPCLKPSKSGQSCVPMHCGHESILDDKSQGSGCDRVTAREKKFLVQEKSWVLLDTYSILTRSKLDDIGRPQC